MTMCWIESLGIYFWITTEYRAKLLSTNKHTPKLLNALEDIDIYWFCQGRYRLITAVYESSS